VLRLLTDKNYRESAVAKVSDEVVRSFWLNEFASWNGQYRTEAVSSVTNKLAPALANRRLRAITSGSTKGTLDLRAVMDRQQILIVNVSRGLLGQDHSTLLGSLLLTAVEQAALSRADRPEAERHPHTLFLDEFQSLLTPSTAIMLSEARKYGLGLVLSHQLTHQLDEVTYHAVVGNCGTMIALRVGLEDAVRLAPAFSKHAGQLTPEDLCNLPNHTAYVRALIAGHPSRPFSLQTLPPPVGDPDRTEIVRRTSARRNAVSVAPPGPNPVPFVSLHPSQMSLYIVATPIGNLEDITLRALRILKEVDLIAAEDTRHSGILLKHFQISKPLTSYHSHSSDAKVRQIVAQLQEGKNVALISDAGTPGISDPAWSLIQAALAAGISIVPIPGPAAFLTALMGSGLPMNEFVYLGFVPAKKGRQTLFESIREEDRTVALYESPHRIQKTLELMLGILGPDRPIVLARELTKLHETFFRGTLQELLDSKEAHKLKGELVLLIGPQSI
jgi:16S rRNA (cytidine1402-2'-O)-methyltransferase